MQGVRGSSPLRSTKTPGKAPNLHSLIRELECLVVVYWTLRRVAAVRSRTFSKYLEGTRQGPRTFAIWTVLAPQSRDTGTTCRWLSLPPAEGFRADDLRPAEQGPWPPWVPRRHAAEVSRERDRRVGPAHGAGRRAASRRRCVVNGGRPRTLIGSYGTISVSRRGASYVALARIRDADGRLRRVTGAARTESAARARLKERLLDRPGFGSGGPARSQQLLP